MPVTDIEPTTLDMVRLVNARTMVGVEGSVGEIARRLKEIDASLNLAYSKESGSFAVWQPYLRRNGEVIRRIITIAAEADDRLVEHMRKVVYLNRNGYDIEEAAQKIQEEAERDAARAMSDIAGDVGERLWHAGTQHGLDQKQKIIPVHRRVRR